jgi:hypothetical protein
MKRFLFVVFVILTGAILLRLAISNRPVQAATFQQAIPTHTAYLSPTPQPTQTEIPSATIGYQETAIIAQQTAMEAVRVNAIITAEFEQRAFAQLQLTAEHDRQVHEIYSWTQTAALTSVPLTATQQYHHNTQVANSQNIIAGQLTSTHEAPTQMAAIINIQNMEKFSIMDHGARAFLMGTSGLAFLLLIIWFIRNPVLPRPEPQQADEEVDKPKSIEFVLRDEKDPWKSQHFALPCSEEQLTELAELVMNGQRTFGYNRMETKSRTFRGPSGREDLEKTRAVLEKARLANNTHAGESVVNERGVQFFEQWFETHELPDGYAFSKSDDAETEVVA